MAICNKLDTALPVFGISPSTIAMDFGQVMSTLGGAKAQGLVGEQANGYPGMISNNGQAADIAAQINAACHTECQEVTNSNGTSLADTEIMAGKKAVEKTPTGQYIQVDGK